MNNSRSLDILSMLILIKSREKRSTELLRSPDGGGGAEDEWYMHVPKAFNDALDIRITDRMINKVKVPTWTQGPSFAFSAGDIIYDRPHPPGIPWSEFMKLVKLVIKVQSAIPAGIPENGVRFPGRAVISILAPNSQGTALAERARHFMSQDDLVRFLITGEIDSA